MRRDPSGYPRVDFGSDDALAQYFIRDPDLTGFLQEALALPKLTKRILLLTGPGGVGKSGHLRLLRRDCAAAGIPLALADGKDHKSELAILQQWAQDLRLGGMALKGYTDRQRSRQHADIQERPSEEQGNNRNKQTGQVITEYASSGLSEIIGIGLTAAGIEPFSVAATKVTTKVATKSVLEPVATRAAESVAGLIRHVFPDRYEPMDAQLKELTQAFLQDLNSSRNRGIHRVVLILDTFESVKQSQRWIAELARKLPNHVLLVVAGQEAPQLEEGRDKWKRWSTVTRIMTLSELDSERMGALVKSGIDYARKNGYQGTAEVDERQIVRAASGTPQRAIDQLATTLVTHVASSEAALELGQRLGLLVPAEMVPVLEAAATLRRFDRSLLRAVVDPAVPARVYERSYDWLRGLGSTRQLGEPVGAAEGEFTLHENVRAEVDIYLRSDAPDERRRLHQRAAEEWERRYPAVQTPTTSRAVLERLYHVTAYDENDGVRIFRQTAEVLVRLSLCAELRTLLNEASTYSTGPTLELWRAYYGARLADREGRLADAEKAYLSIIADGRVDEELRRYAQCDLATILTRSERLSQVGGVDRARALLEAVDRAEQGMDSKTVDNYQSWHTFFSNQGQWEHGIEYLQKQISFYREVNDLDRTLYTMGILKNAFGLVGNWRSAANVVAEGLTLVADLPESRVHRVRLVTFGPWSLIFAGRYAQAEQQLRDGVALAQEIGDPYDLAMWLRELGVVLALQDRFDEAQAALNESSAVYATMEQSAELHRLTSAGVIPGHQGLAYLRAGKYELAEERLTRALQIKAELKDAIGIPELLNWLGELYELKANLLEGADRRRELSKAENCYRRGVSAEITAPAGRRYFECGAITGLARTLYKLENTDEIAELLARAEELSARYEYNDQLSSIRLLRGHLALDGGAPLDDGIALYGEALIYALRYNRFFLYETLAGRPQGSPLLPILQVCARRGEQGRQVLTGLAAWWAGHANLTGARGADSISPIPERIPLVEAEQIAREREPQNGPLPADVRTQIHHALGRVASGWSTVDDRQLAGALCELGRVERIEDLGSKGPLVASAGRESLFHAVFGRDSIRMAMDLLQDFPRVAQVTLVELARLQGVRRNPRADEEPGRILHEHRELDDPRGERLRQRWDLPYYGAVDTTPLWINLLTAYARRIDRAILTATVRNRAGREVTLRSSLNAALRWILTRMDDPAGAGYLWVRRAHPTGIANQVWEDSSDSHYYADGTLLDPDRPYIPVAPQGYAYDALLGAAELLDQEPGRLPIRPARLRERAAALRARVLADFWQADLGTFAQALTVDADGALRPARVVASSPGHLLASRLLDGPDAVYFRDQLAARFSKPDLLASAGIRTKSITAARFRPGAYHNGSCWPMDTGVIADGLRRHGFVEAADELERRIVSACATIGGFPEFFRGDLDDTIRVNTETIDVDEGGGKRNRLEQPPQHTQGWTLTRVWRIQQHSLALSEHRGRH